MDYFPVFVKLDDQQVLVVGGGEIALRKVSLLLKARARVRIIAPKICPSLNNMVAQGKVEYHSRKFDKDDVHGMAMVIAATDDISVNAMVSLLARKKQIPVNVVDSPNLCSFIIPAIIDRSPLLVAVSSGGQAPVLARLLRARLESLIPQNYGRLAVLAANFRDAVKSKIKNMSGRRRFWESVFEGGIGGRVLAGAGLEQARRDMQQALDNVDSDFRIQSELAIVGVSVNDPEMLSIRALHVMQRADVVLYDSLIEEVILERVRRDANKYPLPLGLECQKLLDLAQQGKRVVYLTTADVLGAWKQGDYHSLLQSGLDVQLVPAAPPPVHSAGFSDASVNAGWERLMRFDD